MPPPTVTPTSARTGSVRLLSWDILRVAAVGSVVVQHATYTVAGVMPWMSPTPFTWSIQAGANTLMVISAYFVCVTLATRPPGRWWADRLARLLPAYVAAVVGTYLLTVYASQFGYWRPSGRDLVGNLLLLQGWDSQVTYIDHSYWTLPAQLTMFTLAALATARLGPEFWRRRATLPAVAWGVIVVPVLIMETATPGSVTSTVFLGLVMYRWQVFGIGLAVWLFARGRLGLAHLAALVAAGLAAEYVHTPDLPSVLVLGVAVAGVTAAARGWDGRMLRLGPVPRVVTWLAGLSFGIYLVNQQIGYFVAWGLEARFGVHGWPRLVLVVAVAVVLGWLLTVLVERPAHRWFTERVLGRAQRGKEPAAARKRSTSSGVPALTRTPSPANARTTTLFSSVCSANAVERSPSGSQTKLACEGGTSNPSDRNAEVIRPTSETAPAQSASSSSIPSSAASAAACATDETANGTDTDRSIAASSGGPTA
jgi:peptidoglycan/LPS O-acetylase OafA/YrhL